MVRSLYLKKNCTSAIPSITWASFFGSFNPEGRLFIVNLYQIHFELQTLQYYELCMLYHSFQYRINMFAWHDACLCSDEQFYVNRVL